MIALTILINEFLVKIQNSSVERRNREKLDVFRLLLKCPGYFLLCPGYLSLCPGHFLLCPGYFLLCPQVFYRIRMKIVGNPFNVILFQLLSNGFHYLLYE